MEQGNTAQVFERLGRCGAHKFLLVPYRAVGQPGALLLALRPDGLLVDGRPSQEYLVGVSPEEIALPDGMRAILG